MADSSINIHSIIKGSVFFQLIASRGSRNAINQTQDLIRDVVLRSDQICSEFIKHPLFSNPLELFVVEVDVVWRFCRPIEIGYLFMDSDGEKIDLCDIGNQFFLISYMRVSTILPDFDILAGSDYLNPLSYFIWFRVALKEIKIAPID